MNTFIEVKSPNGTLHFVNIHYIEEVIETTAGCTIYLAHNSPHAIEQDYIDVDMSYEDVKLLIRSET